jgi:hypothetical protein
MEKLLAGCHGCAILELGWQCEARVPMEEYLACPETAIPILIAFWLAKGDWQ